MKTSKIAQNIRQLRVSKGLSQDKLAELAQISLRTVQRIENNETEPRGHSLLQIANALNTTPENLTDFVDNTTTVPTEYEDKNYPIYLNLSALSFILFPLLGIVVPFIIWIVKRGESNKVDRTAKKLLIFQFLWCVLLTAFYISMYNNSFPSFSFMDEGQTLLAVVSILYAINIIFILANAFRKPRYNMVKTL
jgi:transcriptional regulator with XRE-family HTH domain